MSSNTCSGSCGCSPCACSSSGFGCVPDLCVPRPCFFQGQLVTADDLNAMMTYFRTREAMLARFVGGWGVLGGLRVDKAPGIASKKLLSGAAAAVSPNPQLLAGTTIQVLPGAAIDAMGRALTLCSPRILDIAELMAEVPSSPTAKSCNSWFGGLQPICPDLDPGMMTATEYYLIAEYVETPSRPVPQLSGGGACDAGPTCEFSRKLENIRFRLVTSLPASYPHTGCLEPITLSAGSGGSVRSEGGGESTLACFLDTYARFESWAQDAAATCCDQAAVVLARLVITSSPGSLGTGLPTGAPLYVFVLDAYPWRRIVSSAARLTTLTAQLACESGSGGGSGTDGQPAYSRTTAEFIQPAVEATVTIPLQSASWLVAGLPVGIDGVGLYMVTAVAPEDDEITIRNVGMTEIEAGATVAADKLVVVAGYPGDRGENGMNGANGKNAFSHMTATFTQPSVGGSTTVSIFDTSWMVSGQIVYVSTGGWYQVESVSSPWNSAVLKNLGYPPSITPGTTVGMGSVGPSGARGPQVTASPNNKHMPGEVGAEDVGELACSMALTLNPQGYVRVLYNGVGLWTSDGTNDGQVYWSNDGGTTPRALSAVVSGDLLYIGEAWGMAPITSTDYFDFDYLQ